MSYYAINSDTLTSMADTVRAKTDTTDQKTIEDIKAWMEESSSKPVTHTVNFYNGETLIESVTVLDGGTAFCRADLSAVKDSAPEGQYLSHFYPIPTNVKSDMDVFAQFSTPDYEYTEITDSLEEIVASIKDGSVGMKYPIGQKKTIPLSDGTSITMQLTQIYPNFIPAYGFDIITTRWISIKTYYEKKWVMNSNKPELFQSTDVYDYLNTTFNDLLPDVIKLNIKTRCFTILPSDISIKNTVVLDRISIPEIQELFDDKTLLFKRNNPSSRIKVDSYTGEACNYMTCSYTPPLKGLYNRNYYDGIYRITKEGHPQFFAVKNLIGAFCYSAISFSM